MDINNLPKDGRTVLIQYSCKDWKGRPKGTKWEECRWVSRQEQTGSPPHWEPWCGSADTSCTHHIPERDVVAAMPVP